MVNYNGNIIALHYMMTILYPTRQHYSQAVEFTVRSLLGGLAYPHREKCVSQKQVTPHLLQCGAAAISMHCLDPLFV